MTALRRGFFRPIGILTYAEWEALALSLRIAAVVVAVTLPFAVLAAFFLAPASFGKTPADGLVYLPLILPPVAMGISFSLSSARGRLSPHTHANGLFCRPACPCSRSSNP